MPTPLRLALASVLLAAVCAPVHATRHETPGYQPDDLELVRGLPIYVVIDEPTLRPQIAYGYQPIAGLYNGYNANTAGLGVGQAALAGAAGGLIASAIINGAAYAKARNFARPPFHTLQQAQCHRAVGNALGEALAARARANWPGATVTTVVLQPGQKLESAVDTHAPRYVLRASSSIATDYSAVITSIDAEAYLAEGSPAKAARKPAWRDSIIAVSDRVEIAPVKTQADIDALSDVEGRRFIALDLDPRIRKLNDDGPEADRREFNQVRDLLLEHDRLIRDANAPQWTPTAQAMRRAILLSEQQCQRLDASVLLATTQASALLGDLAGGALPAPAAAGDVAAGALPASGERRTQSFPGSIFVSERSGDDVALGFRHSLLGD
jgi:hypothetical protein